VPSLLLRRIDRFRPQRHGGSAAEMLRVALTALGCLVPCVIHAGTEGVRHRIDAIVSIEAGSLLTQKSRDSKGELTFSVRLSANSRESLFFGMVSPKFSDILISSGGDPLVPQTKIWEEEKCHQRRGLPKATVTMVRGSFGTGQEKFEIVSTVRHIGLPIPSDELTPGMKIPAGIDAIGPFYGIRARTRESQLNIDLKIYSFDCDL
jgi:hypothetical protein